MLQKIKLTVLNSQTAYQQHSAYSACYDRRYLTQQLIMVNAQHSSSTEYPHVVLNQENVPLIEGTTLKVVEIVMAQRAYGWTPEEIQINHRYLNMGQIYAALAYYWDHRSRLDADIQRREAIVQQLEQQADESPFVARLRARGLLS
jgi:uncharacterized protein (DUF433 family)